MDLLLKDRATAGRQLANVLAEHGKRGNVLVLAVAPGGVPVAAEIAKSVEAPLDVIVVHKLATSGDDGVVFGAIATGGSRALDWGVVSGMDVSDEMIEAVCTQEETEIERQTKLYRGDRLPPEVSKQRVILVDESRAPETHFPFVIQTYSSQIIRGSFDFVRKHGVLRQGMCAVIRARQSLRKPLAIGLIWINCNENTEEPLACSILEHHSGGADEIHSSGLVTVVRRRAGQVQRRVRRRPARSAVAADARQTHSPGRGRR